MSVFAFRDSLHEGRIFENRTANRGEYRQMATYEKKLKRAKDGCYVRYVGRNVKGQSEKFRLGFDLKEAQKRESLILELWSHQEAHTDWMNPVGFHWTRQYLEAAKAIAKGKPPLLPPSFRMLSNPTEYIEAVNKISTDFVPSDSPLYEEGIKGISREIEAQRRSLLARDNHELTGQTIGEAIAAYRDKLYESSLEPSGSVTTTGRTLLTQLQSWENYLARAFQTKSEKSAKRDFLNLDLAQVTLPMCQEMIDVVRLRPITIESQLKHKKNPDRPLTRLARKSASNIISVIFNFFDWLDLSDDFRWTEPPKFHKLVKSPVRLTADEKYLRNRKKELSTLSDEHIETLSKYALPEERALLLLGLNCAFGPGEIGQLRIPFIKEDTREIVGIRFKTGNDTRHKLWPETLEGLQWQLSNRLQQKRIDDNGQDIVFLTKNGKPIWRKTAAGNYSDGVARCWSRLIDRVRKDYPEFPEFSFGKLRKTAATRILLLADAESASLILAHGTIGEDELLRYYVQLPWEKLYAAQEQFGKAMAPLLALDRPPFVTPPRTYIGLKKSEQIVEMDRQGIRKTEIAKKLGVSTMTVYRHLERVSSD